ncbi:sensor histidine kinase N-terminal domain-containing protein [Providencia hangzhouensis]|uniref:histidine kinase n=4 Tax=Providencia TaxID=586 RepID=A0A9N8D765_PRORE|nr:MULTISPECIES: sensor histidine kinase [Providencia]MBN6365178.1 sensor histidine kinase N-terminal domain-containing protein [Providencia rettgeri]MBN7841880.1 sensor histidine kinase N-terminal domain-containing protein [Providencia rettgeri]MBN7854677.1 sensor histidine kinase N-terminal domain-containing protein [Providencia rettgeri]MBN7864654.1 sensor histidine kinase N-terminal domain-containing protein [Providencia rettgeri]MBN7874693.1 sensor histidine kinase N-terminal domain-conta
MKLVAHPRSLFHQLLLFFGIPLILLGSFSVYTHYYSAKNAANLAYDRTLLASARTVAERLQVVDGHLSVNVPYVVLDSFELNNNDRIFYQVISPDGETISGYDDLPPIPPYWMRSQHYTALVYFYDAQYKGLPIRIAAFYQPINEGGITGMVEIRVAETVYSRQDFANQLLISALMSQGTVVLLTMVLAYILLSKLLAPLKRLSHLMLGRSANDLTPLPDLLPWSDLSPLIDALNRYISRLKRMVRRQERFSADASHQLKTPLTVLKTQVSVAINSTDETQRQQSLQAINKTLDNTIILTDRLLQLSRLKAHEKESITQYRAINLVEIVHQACFTRLSQAESQNIDLGYEGAETAWIKGEPILLAEMCANLIDNAIKYTPANGVVTVRVVSSDDHLHWVLEVEDSGPGIPDAKINRSMEAFTRLNNALGKEGAGLGLALVKDIASYHGSEPQLLKGKLLNGLLVRIAFKASQAPW